MKKITLIVTLLFLITSAKSFSQNDCVDAIVICGDANLSNLGTTGFGVQEIFANACSSQENNSLWLKIKIRTGGTFGFMLTPQSADLVVDYDFWIFGPNVDCSNIGTAIRCSTTNPLNAGINYNTTGMNNTETDTSEGPGADGNAFINWMNVNDNDTYYIAIDRPVGESNFAIAWTGTATFYEIPIIESTADIQICDTGPTPETALFNLTTNDANAIGTQTNVATTYYETYDEAVIGENAIANTTSFQNTSNPQQIFIRLTNTVTGCFVISDFDLLLDRSIEQNAEFSYVSPVCIAGANPMPIISNTSGAGFFTAAPNGLEINNLTGNINLSNSQVGQYTVTYTIPPNNAFCFAPEQTTFDIEIENCGIPRGISPNNDGLNDFFNIEKFDVKALSIFNRYGVKVYHKDNYRKEWNGLSDNGKELPDATYYYLIELNNGDHKTGWVYVNRQQ